jgi:hypothetical protein
MPMMFFYFLKIIFDISTSKRSKKYKPHSILAKKKKNSNFHKTQVETHYQTLPNRHDKQATIIGKKRAIEGSDSLVAGLMKKQRKATAHVWFVNSWFSGIRTLDL